MSEEHTSMEQQPSEMPPIEAPRKEAHQQQGFDPRRRLRELLAIPERDRSDPVWDEIINLEIETAPGNRLAPNESRHQEPSRQQQGRQQQQARRQDGGGGGRPKPGARFFKKRKRGPGAQQS